MYNYIFTLIVFLTFFTLLHAKNSFILISKFQIKSIKYNDSEISFCSREQNIPCVESLDIQFNGKEISIKNKSESKTFGIVHTGPVDIITDAVIRTNDSTTTTAKSDHVESLSYNTTDITMNFIPDIFVVTASLRIQCQEGYMGPGCIYVNLCQTLPQNICRNNGSCVQENGVMKCKCLTGFEGDFCEESRYPCRDNLCSQQSNCQPDKNEKLKYRCVCNKNFTGDFCEESRYPCRDNLCSQQSNCQADKKEKLKYRCVCNKNFTGQFCHTRLNPCDENLCHNNATCLPDKSEKLHYRCECKDEYHGQLCSMSVDNCARNLTLCSEFVNATCLSRIGGHLCHCEGGCKRTSDMISQSGQSSLPFKWPFSELITFLFVLLEGVIIFVLIVLIIIVRGCCRHEQQRHKLFLDDHLLSVNGTKMDTGCIEFGSNYASKPMVMDDMETSQTINPLFDLSEMQSFSNNNHLDMDTPGMSTFGRRQ